MFCVAIGAGILPVYLTTFGEEFGGLGPAQLGLLPGVLFAGFVVGIVLSGPMADRFGARLFAVLGAAICAGGLAGAGLAPAYPLLVAAAGILGLGAGVLDMLMSPIVAAVSTDRKASALNQLHAYYSVGVVASVVCGSVALSLGVPWRATLLVLALLPALVAADFARAAFPALVHPEQERHRLRRLLRMPRFHLALLMILLIGATEEGMSQWLPAYLETALGYSKPVAGYALAAYAVAQASGRFLGSTQIAARIGPHRLLMLCAGASAACYLLAAWAPLPLIGALACMLTGFACSMLWPTHLGITSDRIPHGGASMFGVMAAAGNVGCVLAPWSEGIIAARHGLNVALASGALPPLLLLVLAAVLYWSKRRQAADGAGFA
ncbi:MAG: hypothetical protein RLZZ303_3389 [Candidatus Hydrogenedentota bacterium]|jgi:fucose permease